MPRQSRGRQRINIERITEEKSSMVTFSKRRSGVFKKASELCTLCGVQMAIIVLSQNGKKVYSLGEPSVEVIVNRFMEQNFNSPGSLTSQIMELQHNSRIEELNNQLTSMLEQLESEKNAREELNETRKENQAKCWWDAPVENLGTEDLEHLKLAMLELKEISLRQAERLTAAAANPTPMLQISGSSST